MGYSPSLRGQLEHSSLGDAITRKQVALTRFTWSKTSRWNRDFRCLFFHYDIRVPTERRNTTGSNGCANLAANSVGSWMPF